MDNLHDDESVIRLCSDNLQEGRDTVSHCLVGKVLSKKYINRDLFKKVMEQVWGVMGRVEVEKMEDNTFLFNFNTVEDKNRVWVRGPWHFDRSLIVMEKMTGVGEVSSLEFHKSEMWIQMHNLPLILRNRRMIKVLAEKIGAAVEIPLENRECSGRFVRVKVVVYVRMPLKKELKLALEGFEGRVVIPLRYEKLPDFCFACGRIGHVWKECINEETKRNILEGAEVEYGSWLRASLGGKQEADKIAGVGRETGQAGSENMKQGWREQEVDSEANSRLLESKGVTGERQNLVPFGSESSRRRGGALRLEDGQSYAFITLEGGKEVRIGEGVKEGGSNLNRRLSGIEEDMVTEGGDTSPSARGKSIGVIDENDQAHPLERVHSSGKKWKKAARKHPLVGRLASPAHRLINAKQSRRKTIINASLVQDSNTNSIKLREEVLADIKERLVNNRKSRKLTIGTEKEGGVRRGTLEHSHQEEVSSFVSAEPEDQARRAL